MAGVITDKTLLDRNDSGLFVASAGILVALPNRILILGFNGAWMAWKGLDALPLAFFPTGPSLGILAASVSLFLADVVSAFALKTVFWLSFRFPLVTLL